MNSKTKPVKYGSLGEHPKGLRHNNRIRGLCENPEHNILNYSFEVLDIVYTQPSANVVLRRPANRDESLARLRPFLRTGVNGDFEVGGDLRQQKWGNLARHDTIEYRVC